MGEYARLTNFAEIKIGTCEDMYYLRYDQRGDVIQLPGSVDPAGPERYLLRFRFPFPDEDGIQPGGFKDAFRGYAVGVKPPSNVAHRGTRVENDRGLVCNVPCPFREPEATEIEYFAKPRITEITQQKPHCDGRLMLICRCGVCGVKWRCESVEDASPVVRYLLGYSEPESEEIARRILSGYGLTLEEWKLTEPTD